MSIYELNSRALFIRTYEKETLYIRKEQKYVSFAAGHLKAASFGTFSHNFCFILKNI